MRRPAVLGAGVMGGGIAHLVADQAGLPVRVKDVRPEALATALRPRCRPVREAGTPPAPRAGRDAPAHGPAAATLPSSALAFGSLPWLATRRLGFLDLETCYSAEEVGGWHQCHPMRVSLAVLIETRPARVTAFREDDLDRLCQCLHELDLIVGFNLKRFDYRVLQPYAAKALASLPTLDILEELHNLLGFRLSLGHLTEKTLGEGKTGNGLLALEHYRAGRWEELESYCRQDVILTRRLFEFGAEQGYLIYRHRQVTLVRVPVEWHVGTKTLTFEYDSELIDRMPKATEYRVTVPAGTMSASGGVLAQPVSWSFRTPPPKTTSVYPDTTPQPLNPVFFIAFDQRIDPAAVLGTITVNAGGQNVSTVLASQAEIEEDERVSQLAKNTPDGRWLAFRAEGAFQPETNISVAIGPGTPSAEGPLTTTDIQSFSFSTYAPLQGSWHTAAPGTTTIARR